MRHVFVTDEQTGADIGVRMRGPMTPEIADAFKEVARLALDHVAATSATGDRPCGRRPEDEGLVAPASRARGGGRA